METQHFPTKDKLHTDVLVEKYGQIRAQVIRHDHDIRVAKLIDGQGILRTYAVTFFGFDRNNAELVSIDDEIREGGLIGQTFRKHGYTVKKNVVSVFLAPLNATLMNEFKTDLHVAKARITEFYAKKADARPDIYGTVLEVYSPDFRDPRNGINEIDRVQLNPPISFLEEVGISVDEIWSRLDRANDPDEWQDLQSKYDSAFRKGAVYVESVRQKCIAMLK